MTINSDLSRARYVGNGVTDTFAIPFAYLTNNDGTAQIAVYLGDSDTPLIEGKDYTVKGFGKYSDNQIDEDLITYETRYENGEFTLNNAPMIGEAVAVVRNVPQTQGVVFVEGEKFPAKDFENALDKLTMQMQEAKESLNRAIVLPPTSTESPLEARNAIIKAKDKAIASANEALASEKASEENKNIAVNSANEATASKNIILNDVGFQTIATDLLGDNKIGYVAENLDDVAGNVAEAVAAATMANQAADRANEIAETSKIEIENKSQSALNDILKKTEDAKSDIQSATEASITNINNTVSAEIIPNLEGYVSSATNQASIATSKANEAQASASAAKTSETNAKSYVDSLRPETFVKTSGEQTINGTKTFTSRQIIQSFASDTGGNGFKIQDSNNKGYVALYEYITNDGSHFARLLNNSYGKNAYIDIQTSSAGVSTINLSNADSMKAKTPSAISNDTNIATTAWVNTKIASSLPAGTILPYGGSTAPSGFLLCNGSTVSRTTYANLFKAIGTTYGTGDGSTTFALPNLSSARMVTSSTVSIKGDGKALGLTNGSEYVGLARNGDGTFTVVKTAYGEAVTTSTTNLSDAIKGKLGVTTDATKSGVTGTSSLAQSIKFIIKY